MIKKGDKGRREKFCGMSVFHVDGFMQRVPKTLPVARYEVVDVDDDWLYLKSRAFPGANIKARKL